MSTVPNDLTCIHREHGLCPQCRANYDEDPTAWIEYGDWCGGIANWKALQAEIAAEANWADYDRHLAEQDAQRLAELESRNESGPPDDCDIPF